MNTSFDKFSSVCVKKNFIYIIYIESDSYKIKLMLNGSDSFRMIFFINFLNHIKSKNLKFN